MYMVLPGNQHLELRAEQQGNSIKEGGPRAEHRDMGILNYTSGTTGPPKGVFTTSQVLLTRVHGGKSTISFCPDDKVAVPVPVTTATHRFSTLFTCAGTHASAGGSKSIL